MVLEDLDTNSSSLESGLGSLENGLISSLRVLISRWNADGIPVPLFAASRGHGMAWINIASRRLETLEP